MEYIYDYYVKNGTYPSVSEIKERLNCFRNLIAYRIVISMQRCNLEKLEDREQEELKNLYEIEELIKDEWFDIITDKLLGRSKPMKRQGEQ